MTTKAVVNALSQFISMFGIHKVSDQGPNVSWAGVKFVAHSTEPHHAQFHPALQSNLRTECTQLERDWDDRLQLLMLVAKEAEQVQALCLWTFCAWSLVNNERWLCWYRVACETS